MSETIKAMSVRQPWAWGLVFGPKRIENRSRRIHYRGPLVIHSGRSHEEWLGRPYGEWLSLMPGLPSTLPDESHFGVLYGIVDLIDCVPFERVADDPFAEGPWCWIVENPRPVEPMPFRGVLGLFDVPADQIVIRPSR